MKGKRNSIRWYLVAGTLAVALAGTGCTRPYSMQVREGGDPTHADDDVAFRTTYYFRVFDYCTNLRRQTLNAKLDLPLNDTIYRFRMTGKSSTLLSNIRFESGTLSAAEIEPFGASVSYDKELGRFRFESKQDLEARARRKTAIASFREVMELYKDEKLFGTPNSTDTELINLRKKIAGALGQLVDDFVQKTQPQANAQVSARASLIEESSISEPKREGKKTTLNFSAQTPPQVVQKYTLEIEEDDEGNLIRKLTAEGGAAVTSVERPAAIECQDTGAPTRRGFQILGPEGWRTFDQDERLLLAMSADSQPLIGTLKELSQRLLQSREASFAYRLPLAEERLRVAQTNDQLDTRDDNDIPKDVLDRAIRVFTVSTDKPGDPK